MITLRPVLEVPRGEEFSLWPVAETGWFLPLDGSISQAEIGSAVMAVAKTCSPRTTEASQPPAGDQVESFLHGMLVAERVSAFGGLSLEDSVTGASVEPGCCVALGEWRGWYGLLDGTGAYLGHSPSPGSELVDDVVRMTVDTEEADSATIEVPVADLRRLLAGVERDLTDFVGTVSGWAARHAPSRASDLATVFARALDVGVSEPSPS